MLQLVCYTHRYTIQRRYSLLSPMVYSSLSSQIACQQWSELHTLYALSKDVAALIRKESKKKQQSLVSLIMHRSLKPITSSISRLFHHQYSDEALLVLIKTTVQQLRLLLLELNRKFQDQFVAELEQMASILVSFLPEHDETGVQLLLFDWQDYRAATPPRVMFPSFLEWCSTLIVKTSNPACCSFPKICAYQFPLFVYTPKRIG